MVAKHNKEQAVAAAKEVAALKKKELAAEKERKLEKLKLLEDTMKKNSKNPAAESRCCNKYKQGQHRQANSCSICRTKESNLCSTQI